jgi:hypothetical protein
MKGTLASVRASRMELETQGDSSGVVNSVMAHKYNFFSNLFLLSFFASSITFYIPIVFTFIFPTGGLHHYLVFPNQQTDNDDGHTVTLSFS